jgi:hypothetical protein
MKLPPFFFATLLLLGTAGCASTPERRITKNDAAFAQWPVAVQEKVRAGQIDLGFTTEQVRTALGEPDRKFARTTNDGTSEIWAYRDDKPRFSFGIGLGFGGGGRSSTAVGVGASTSDFRTDERLHVIFEGGRVSAIESTKQK